jgi:hypothetical protein
MKRTSLTDPLIQSLMFWVAVAVAVYAFMHLP